MIAHHIHTGPCLNPRVAPGGNLTSMPQPSILSMLRERAGSQPVEIAFTYITSHGLNVADLVLVAPGQHRQAQFARLDA
jgi:hypothetical protein